jgi:hypothetical protein
VSSDGEAWLLVEATPDVLRQLESFDGLHPREGAPSPLAAVLVTGAGIERTAGLRALRVGGVDGIPVHAPAPVVSELAATEAGFSLRAIEPDQPAAIAGTGGELGLTVTLLALPGGAAGLWIREPASGKLLVYLPTLPEGFSFAHLADGADALFLDAARADPERRAESKVRVLTRVAHDSPLADETTAAWKALKRSAWTLAHDGLDLFV